MDSTKKTIAISALLLSSVTLLTLGLYLKAMNSDVTASTDEKPMPMGEHMQEMHMRMPEMPMHQQMMEEMVAEEEETMPPATAFNPDDELSEEELNVLLSEIENMPEEATREEEEEEVSVEKPE